MVGKLVIVITYNLKLLLKGYFVTKFFYFQNLLLFLWGGGR